LGFALRRSLRVCSLDVARDLTTIEEVWKYFLMTHTSFRRRRMPKR